MSTRTAPPDGLPALPPPLPKVNLAEKLAKIDEPWRPKIVAELNGQEVRVVRIEGAFVWHRHDNEDELFLVVSGRLRVELRDGVVELSPGELVVVPRGVEHRTASEEGAEVVVFEPAATRNTGNVVDPRFTAPTGVRI